MEIISRKEAISKNLKFYYTGKKCRKGHITKRYTNGSHCCECRLGRKDYHKAWYNKNKDRALTEDKIYYQKNKETILKRNKTYLKIWKQRNAEHLKAYGKQKRIRRRIEIRANNSKRRANRLCATPKWANLKAIEDIYRNCPENFHVDHVIPLNNKLVCGLHVENNLQYLSAKENLKKGNKFLPIITGV